MRTWTCKVPNHTGSQNHREARYHEPHTTERYKKSVDAGCEGQMTTNTCVTKPCFVMFCVNIDILDSCLQPGARVAHARLETPLACRRVSLCWRVCVPSQQCVPSVAARVLAGGHDLQTDPSDCYLTMSPRHATGLDSIRPGLTYSNLQYIDSGNRNSHPSCVLRDVIGYTALRLFICVKSKLRPYL